MLLSAAPSNLTATAVSSSQIDLAWVDNSTDDSGFRIEQSSNGTYWYWAGYAAADATTFAAAGPFDPSTIYYFRIRAYPDSDYSNIASVTTPAFPNQPTGLIATAVSDTRIDLSWTDVASEDGYRIERSLDNTAWAQVGTTAADAASFSDTGLSEGTKYYYRLVAFNAQGDSAYSTVRAATTQPSAPSDLTATAISSTAINLDWTDNSIVEGNYFIEQSLDGSNWTRIHITTANTTTFTATGPFDGSTIYYFRVRASYPYSDYSNIASVTTAAFPNQPTGLTATAVSDMRIDLSWMDVANENGYRIERSLDNNTWTQVGAVTADVTSFSDTGLTELTGYHYRIVAYNVQGDSGSSLTRYAATPLAAPSNLTATVVSATAINLAWTDNSMAGIGYYVEKSLDRSNWDYIATIGDNPTSFTATGPLDGSTTYYFRVRARSHYSISDRSNIASATTAAFPNQPTGLTATAVSDTQIDLTWTDVANEDGYRIERSLDNIMWTHVSTTAADVASFSDTLLSEGTTYYYRVVAFNIQGDSALSEVRSVTTSLTAPTDLTVTAVSATAIDLTWTDNSGAENSYSVEQSLDGGNWSYIGTATANATNFTATGPFDGSTTYYFRVRAYYPFSVYSNYSNVASVTTTFPSAPADLTATASVIPGDGVQLDWIDVANEAGYRIFHSTSGIGNWSEIDTLGANITSYIDDTISTDGYYTYRVFAFNNAGDSILTESESVFALAANDDYDNDDLNNLDEHNSGTDAFYFDTDNDLLSDGWEVEYGFDPLDADEDDNGTPDAQDDEDGDGLDNLDESNRGTDPGASDTDGDGVPDDEEAGQGSDPTDPTDGGEPPADDMKAKYRITVGDNSGSHSERWALEVGDIRHTSPGFGVVGHGDYWFDAGESYEVRLDHLGTDPEYLNQVGRPDYDWRASIAPTPGEAALPYFIVDEGPDKILGTYGPSTENTAEGEVAYFHIPLLDADVDSDNNDAFNAPARTDEEDRLERDPDAGKHVWTNTGDIDGDDVIDYEDYDGIAGVQFVPLVLSLSDNLQEADLTNVELTFTYNGSILRLWTKDADEARDANADLLESGIAIAAEDLALTPGGEVILYIEAIEATISPVSITVTANISGNEWSGALDDTIHVLPIGVNLTAHRTGEQLGQPLTEEIENEGDSSKYLILTNNDFEQDLSNGRPDFDDLQAATPGAGGQIDDDLAKITLTKIPAGLTDGSIEIQLSHPGAVSLFKSDGSLLYDSVATGAAPLTLDLANPSGYLADLASGNVDVWLEGLASVPDFTFSIVYKDAAGQEVGRDDVHINIAELTFVNADGVEVRVIPPMWKESLIALAESGIDMTGKALPSFFKMRVEGLAGAGPFEMTGQSNTYPADQFEDVLVPVGLYTYESEHYITMYSSENVYGASPDLPLTAAERQLLLTQLDLNAVHNEEGTFKITSHALEGMAQTRIVETREFVGITLSQDVAHSGDTITTTVTHPSAENDWVWTATLPDGSTQRRQGKSVSFTFQVNTVGDRVFHVEALDNDWMLFSTVTISASGSSRIRVLPVGEQMSQWELAAWEALRIGGRIGGVSGDPIRLNRVITENYAEIYNEAKDDAQLKDAFQWAGMAAFASNAVGNALALSEYWATLPVPNGPPLSPSPETAYDLLSKGNFDFYMDLFPQHIAYRDGGIAAIRAMRAADEITQEQLDAWELIDQGVVNDDASNIWDGNKLLLQYEQQTLLQTTVFGVNPQYWADATDHWNPWVPPFESPIPGHGVSFQEYRAQSPAVPDTASFGNFNARWVWISNEDQDPNTPESMFEAWKYWNATNGDIDVQKLLNDEY